MLFQYLRSRKIGLVVTEHILLLTCVLMDATGSVDGPSVDNSTTFFGALVIALTFQVSLHLMDVYDFSSEVAQPNSLKRLAQGLLLASSVVAGAQAVFVPTAMADLVVILLRMSAFLIVWHVLLRVYFRIRPDRSNVIIVGTGELARAIAREILERKELGLKVSGFTDDDPELLGVSIVNPSVVALTSDLSEAVSERNVDQIVVELKDRRGKLPIDQLLTLKASGIKIDEAASYYERLTGKLAIMNLKPSWIVFNERFKVSRWVLIQQRILCLSTTLPLLILFIPFFPVIAMLIKLDSRGPILFGQERVGQHGRRFRLWKFRSMRDDAERDSGPVWAMDKDERVTRVGRYLRRMRLDELPQLYNVLKGDMSLIGPRPERPYFVERLTKEIPFYGLRHLVRPGLTGWAQINYRYGSSVEDAVEKAQYDLFYIENMSLLLDAVIMFDTAKTMLRLRGA